MDLFVKGYTYFVTAAVLVSMLAVLFSAESHIRSVMRQSMVKQEDILNEQVVIDPDYYIRTYDFRENKLHTEVENRRLFLFSDYVRAPVKAIPIALYSEEYSSFGTIDSGKGFDLVFLRNVCYDSESARVLLFGNTLDKSLLTQIMDKIPRSDFLAVVDGKYPTAAEVGEVSSVGSYLFFTDDAMDRVSQFSSLNFIVHFMHHATRYPSMLHAFLPFFSISRDSDTYEYISILQSFFSPQKAFDVFYKDDLPKGLTCFRELTIPTLIRYAHEGSIHLDLYEADTTRIAAYAYYRYYERFPVPHTAIVLHITYKADASGEGVIANMDEVSAFFQKKVAIWSYRTMVIDGVTKAAKIRALFETDILMGISSDLFVNMVYLVPGSCVLAINHNLMTSSHLNSIAEQSQLFYLEISNFSVPLPPLCKDKESDVVFHKYSERCKQELLKTNVYVQPGMLMSYLRVAKTYTMIHKYYDESEGDYSLGAMDT
ncbi:hypothetical protein BLSTO_01644 [Blastocystis sp. subtype 1]